MEKRKKTDHKNHDQPKRNTGNPSDILIYPIISNVASMGETTGMMPTPPMTWGEYDSFRMMSSMELPEVPEPGSENDGD